MHFITKTTNNMLVYPDTSSQFSNVKPIGSLINWQLMWLFAKYKSPIKNPKTKVIK